MTYSFTPRISLVKVTPGSGQTVDHAATLTADMDILDNKFVGRLVSTTARPSLSEFDGQILYETDTYTFSEDDGTSWSPIGQARFGTDKTAQSNIALPNATPVFAPFDGDGGGGATWNWIDSSTLQFLVPGYFWVNYNYRINDAPTGGGRREVAFIRQNSSGVEQERYDSECSCIGASAAFTMNHNALIRVPAATNRLKIELVQNTNAATINTDPDFHLTNIDIVFIRPLMGNGAM